MLTKLMPSIVLATLALFCFYLAGDLLNTGLGSLYEQGMAAGAALLAVGFTVAAAVAAAWYLIPSAQKLMITIGVWILVVLLLASILPGVANATEIGAGGNVDLAAILNPPETDRTLRYLKILFGPLLDEQSADTYQSVFFQMFGVFNAMLLGVAVVFLSYNIGVGIMQTANDGEFLGREWSGLWAPLRIAVVMGMMFPLPSGFTVIQYVSVKTAVIGIGLADQLWGKMAEGITSGRPIIAFESPEANIFAREVFMSELCANYINAHESQKRERAFVAVRANSVKRADTGDFEISYDGEPGTGYPNGVCGAFRLEVGEVSQRAEILSQAPNTSSGVLDKIRAMFTGPDSAIEITDQLLSRQVDASQNLVASMSALSFQMVSEKLQRVQAGADAPSWGNPPHSLAASALANYSNTLKQAVATAQQQINGAEFNVLRGQMVQQGWADAGTWWWTINRMNQRVNQAANIAPGMTTRFDEIKVAESTDAREFAELLAHARVWWSQVAYQPDSRVNTSMVINLVDPTRKLNGEPTYSAFSGLMSLGNSLVNTGLAILGVGKAATVALDMVPVLRAGKAASALKAVVERGQISSEAGNQSRAGKFMSGLLTSSLGQAALTAGAVLSLVGFVLAYVLPLLPVIVFTLATLSWVLIVIEAVVAAPLWALTHMQMDGREFVTSKASPGYIISLNIFLRPSLMMFGMLASYVIFEFFAGFLTERFGQVLFNIHGGDTSISNFVYAVVFTGLMFLAATKSFGLISELPDRVMRWLGASGAEGGSDSFTQGIATAAAGGAATAGAMSMRNAAGATMAAAKSPTPPRHKSGGVVGPGDAR